MPVSRLDCPFDCIDDILAFSLPNSEAESRHQNTVVELSNIID